MLSAFLVSHESPMWHAFVSRTDCIYGTVEMLVLFFQCAQLPIFLGMESRRACLPSVELPVAHWSDRNVVGISLSPPMVAGYAFVSRMDCIYGAVWKCL